MCFENDEETDGNQSDYNDDHISDVHCDTVYSIFRISIKSNDEENDEDNYINWSIIKADVLIVDEIATVNVNNLQQIGAI